MSEEITTLDVTMSDVDVNLVNDAEELALETQKVVKMMIAEVQVIVTAVSSMDLSSLARVKSVGLKKCVTVPILRRCIQLFLLGVESASTQSVTVSATKTVTGATTSAKNESSVTASAADNSTNASISKTSKLMGEILLSALNAAEAPKKSSPSSELDEKSEKILGTAATKKVLECQEIAFFLAIPVLDLLINKAETDTLPVLITQIVVQLGNLNRRTLDFFATKVYHYFARITQDSELIRNDFLAIYRTACLRHDTGTQATMLNLILRNYLKHNLYDQAAQFVNKTTFPENGTNGELARYLFQIGRMKAVQMEYNEAHNKLSLALRRAPQAPKKALAFKVIATKFQLVVELLMGEIPERKRFLHFPGYLRPYEEIAQAVRGGSIPQFEQIVRDNKTVFVGDNTLSLVNRLRYNVIKTGLRKINFSYSRISLQDVCSKLGLDTPEDAAGICSKAIADCVINATLDYDSGELLSKEIQDVYSTDEPQMQLHKRIAFCLQMHNESVKKMEYPKNNQDSNADKEEEEDQVTKNNKETAELVKEIEEDDIDML